MPVLREDSVLIMDGAVKLYRRERSRKWQAAFQIDGQYIRGILLDVTVKDENDLIQWEVFSGVRVDNLYPDHTGVALELSDSFETHT